MILSGVQRAVAVLFAAMLAVILAVVLLCYDNTQFYFKIHFLLPQGVLLAAGLLLLGAVSALLLRFARERPRAQGLRGALFAAAPWLMLFAFQVIACYHSYALPGMDANILLSAAYELGFGDGYITPEYYWTYPNNAFLTIVYGAVLRCARLALGHMGFDRSVLILLVFQCALCSTAGWLTVRTARMLTGSARFAGLVGAMFVLFAGISPWITYPYSDCTGLIFPVLILYLYARREQTRHPVAHWLLLALVILAAYLIKPQTAIMGIAVCLMELARALSEGEWRRGVFRTAAVLLTVLVGAGPAFQALVRCTPISLDKTKSVGILHYMAMGLSEETNGTYNAEDVLDMLALETPAERSGMFREKIAARIREMGLGGLLEHLKKKTLANYADGTFSWGGDCTGEDYYLALIDDKDALLSPFFKDMIDFVDGKRYPYLATYLHGVWLTLLAGCLLSAFAFRALNGRGRHMLCVMLLSVIGLTLFEWIFEAQSRYLFTYIPVYLLIGLSGLWYAVRWGMRKKGAA